MLTTINKLSRFYLCIYWFIPICNKNYERRESCKFEEVEVGREMGLVGRREKTEERNKHILIKFLNEQLNSSQNGRCKIVQEQNLDRSFPPF